MCKISRPLLKSFFSKFDLKPSAAEFSTDFSKCHKLRREVVGDVISGRDADYVGMDDRGKVGDNRLNSGRIIRLFGRPDPFLLCSI